MEGGLVHEIIRWFAAGTGTCAAIMVSLNFSRRTTARGFMVFTVSSVAWVAAGILTDQPSLVAQNGVLTLVNIVGIYRWAGPRPPKGATPGGTPQ